MVNKYKRVNANNINLIFTFFFQKIINNNDFLLIERN